MSVKNVLYLHGFNSHAASFKARLTAEACARLPSAPRFIAPNLTIEPDQAIATIEGLLDDCEGETALIGSSMGGFYATCIAEKHGLKHLALVNPAVMPAEFARPLAGQVHYNPEIDSRVVIEHHHVDQLEVLQTASVSRPEHYLVMLSGQDEVLDHRRALAHYRGASVLVDPSGKHAFARYADYLPRVLAHLGLIG